MVVLGAQHGGERDTGRADQKRRKVQRACIVNKKAYGYFADAMRHAAVLYSSTSQVVLPPTTPVVGIFYIAEKRTEAGPLRLLAVLLHG